ncbi:hypothetical protein CBZ97_004165 [Salmonella enterica]|nr:hypothetical protein [Salmonella enterica]MBA3210844.1 hypothetical protein [Salmonella enterica]VEA96391.1 Uncharacterised protein [Salmonella enterica subsp. houtenae]
MKLFSQGPVSWFDFGIAMGMMAVIWACFLTYRIVVDPPEPERVCELKNTPQGNKAPEKQIRALCEKDRKRIKQTR